MTATDRPGGARARAAQWLALAFTALVPVLFHLPYASGDRIGYGLAAAHEQYPRYKILCDALQAEGRLPLWQTWLCAGTPFHANPENPTLYPPVLLLALFCTPVWTMNATILAHLSFAALGMFFLVRRLWLRLDATPRASATAVAGAVVGGIVFALSGWTRADLLNGVAQGGTHGFIPWVLLAADAMLEGRHPRRSAGALALLLGYLVLSGNLYAILYGTLALVVWIAVLGVLSGGERARRALTFGVLAASLAALIVSGKLLPFREWVAITNRAGPLEYREALGMSLAGTGGSFDAALLLERLTRYTAFGLAPALALLALPLLRAPEVRVAFAFAVCCLLIAIGTPLHRALYELVPLFDQTRGANRAWTGVNAFQPLLAGLGCCGLLARIARHRGGPVARAALGMAVALLVAPVIAYAFDYQKLFRSPQRFSELAGRYTQWPEIARRCGTEWRATNLDLATPIERNEQFVSTLLEVETTSGNLGHIWPSALELHLYGTPSERLSPETRMRRRATLSVRWMASTSPDGPPVSTRVRPLGIDGNVVVENPLARARAVEPSVVAAVYGDESREATYALLDDPAFPLAEAATIQLARDRELSAEELRALDALVVRGEATSRTESAAAAMRAGGKPVLAVGSQLSDDDRAGLTALVQELSRGAEQREPVVDAFERAGSGASRVTRGDAARGRWLIVSEPWSLYVGWTAVAESGATARIEAADGVSSAVFLPGGERSLRAEYAPRSVVAGLWLHCAGVLAALLVALWPEGARPLPKARLPILGNAG